jgi:hypothetical protein
LPYDNSTMNIQTETALLYLLIGLTWLLLLGLWLSTRKKFALLRSVMKTTGKATLEELLLQHLRDKERLEKDLRETVKRVEELEKHALRAVSSAGLVRYDAFEDVGGHQSFALALQSETGDGVILHCITGREQIRLYCKETRRGRSPQNLSPEEEEALKRARQFLSAEQV